MLNFNGRQLIKLILVLMLFIAPFEVLFANVHTGHESETTPMSDHHTSMASSDAEHIPDTNDANYHSVKLDKDCEKQCTHCIFCNIAMFSLVYSNENLQFIYSPHVSNSPSGVIAEVDIRPPKILTSN